ncbi:MAG: hypothetical protein HY965_06000 [Ignavibacteriales bacterium]|nr:hypothetical protein [Ignavibacteriales bacterium]
METWFEIFKTGVHTDANGATREWTENDLDAIVAAYNGNGHEAPIVIGHPEGTAPAYGWIGELKRCGNILLASAKQIMPEFAELVNAGRYKKVSIALAAGNLLHHIAFLGAIAPAVTGLADAQFSGDMVTTEITPADDETVSNTTAGISQTPENVAAPALPAPDKFEQRLNALEDSLTKLFAASSFPAVTFASPEALDDGLHNLLSNSVTTGKITPAQKSLAMQMFSMLAPGTSADCTAQENPAQSILPLFKQFIDLQQPHLLFNEFTPPVTAGHHTPASEFERMRSIIQKNMNTIE